jgi:hypothetical protein
MRERGPGGEQAVSEIVGALLLVLVVSSAAFGFGLFLHQQQKETQAQQAAELAIRLEKLSLAAVAPAAGAFDASCPGIPGDASWHALTATVTSLHLHDSVLASLRLNHATVRTAILVGATRTVLDAATTAGSATVTSAGGHFRDADLGQAIAGPGIPPGATITAVASPNSVTLSLQATATATMAATVGGTPHDFGLPVQPDPALPNYNPDAVIPARHTVRILLPNLAMDEALCGAATTAPYSLFGGAPATGSPGPVLQTDALDLEAVTALGNRVERVYTPPVAQASLEPVTGAAGSYVLVGTGSQPGSEDTPIVKWAWEYWHAAACDAAGTGVARPLGHRAQVSGLTAGDDYCARLTVTDTNGLTGQAELVFTA